MRKKQRGFFVLPPGLGMTKPAGGGGLVESGLVFHLNAGISASYPGSGQTWSNLVASPADGSAQSAYDYYLGSGSGSDGGEPTFNGSAGVAGAYLGFGGGQYLTLAGAATTFLKNLHKSGTKFSFMAVVYVGGGGGSGICPIWDSGTSDQGGSDMSRGVIFADQGSIGGSERNGIRVKRDSSAQNALSVNADNAITANQIRVIGCSVDGTGGDLSFLVQQGAYDQVSSSNTFNGTLSSPGSSDTTNSSRIGARGDAAQTFVGRLYAIAAWNRNLTKAEMDTCYAYFQTQLGL